MFGLSPQVFLLLDALVAIVLLILLITRWRFHPFVALMLAAGFLGLTSGMPVDKVMAAFQKGFGDTLGFVGIVLGLGTMLGMMMAESGGADRIARTLIAKFGRERVHWAIMLAAFIAGLPLFFEIGLVLLAPLVFIVARRAGVSLVKVGVSLLAALSVVHALIPPHPGPLLAIQAFGADMGKTILYGLIVGLPTAILAGPLFASFISRYVPGKLTSEMAEQFVQERDEKDMPGFGITVFTVLLPVILMLLKAFADIFLPAETTARVWLDFIGHPINALLIALLLALYTFGYGRGYEGKQILKFLEKSLAPTAAIVMIIGAGGGFKQMLVSSGVGDAIGHMAVQAQLSPIVLAWTVAALIRIATGSATVAIITGAGIVAPVIALVPGVNRELLVLAAGAGSVMFSHVNDAGFWLVKQYFNLTVVETFKTWSVLETIISVAGQVFVLLLGLVV
ncbi:MAG: High-affinity gluconate transporter [Paracidovorax wautersii]|uniref:High-affinity gluconate transporter n=1 Tax=Paracidovorax wautersii TaxID=1177982 RepID=A0A7V8FSD3_9BURK|nr:MAG: High-affinity gluconate transporter [Paracidovorax wautersii]